MNNTYSDYTIEISLESPIVTGFQADTIFGHICWAIRFLYGEQSKKIEDFLNCYERSESPPLLVSNGFNKGFLPKPILPPVSQEGIDSIVGETNRIEKSFAIKTIKKLELIRKDCLEELQQTGLTPYNLFKLMYDNYEDLIGQLRIEQTSIVQHNTINRASGKVKPGGLFTQQESFYDLNGSNGGDFEVYIKTFYFSEKELQEIFDYIKEEGFGKDKSTGRGHFSFEINKGIDLPEWNNPNSFMTLSSYIPTEDDPTEGHYAILHKFGKLGSIYAQGSSEVGNNPFKKPLIMFTSGSTFFDNSYDQKKVYGSLLKSMHDNEKIRHYAYAFPIGIRIGETNENT